MSTTIIPDSRLLRPHAAASPRPRGRKCLLCATLAGACAIGGWAKAEDAVAAPDSKGTVIHAGHWLQFTADEIEHYREIGARRARQEAYIHASEDDDVITLAPYVVESDDSLVLARIRRELENYRSTAPSRIAGLTPLFDEHLRLARQADKAFFSERPVGGPADAGGALYIDQHAPAKILHTLRGGHIADLFAPPAGSE